MSNLPHCTPCSQRCMSDRIECKLYHSPLHDVAWHRPPQQELWSAGQSESASQEHAVSWQVSSQQKPEQQLSPVLQDSAGPPSRPLFLHSARHGGTVSQSQGHCRPIMLAAGKKLQSNSCHLLGERLSIPQNERAHTCLGLRCREGPYVRVR